MAWIRRQIAAAARLVEDAATDSKWRRVESGLEARRPVRFTDTDALGSFLERLCREFPDHNVQLEVARTIYQEDAHSDGVTRLARGTEEEGAVLRVHANAGEDDASWGLELLGVREQRASRIVSGNLAIAWPPRWDVLERVARLVDEHTVRYGRPERRRMAPLVEAVSREAVVQNAMTRDIAQSSARTGARWGAVWGALAGLVTSLAAWLIERGLG